MDNLDRYAQYFDTAYRDYADARYTGIVRLVSSYDAEGILNIIDGQQFGECIKLLQPLIAIKNYKSQVPFPENLREVLRLIINIRQTEVGSSDVFSNHDKYFKQLVSLQGFQLPTASAVFHFCHPKSFPIVDVNVKEACAHLKDLNQKEFANLEAPGLPASNTSSDNKLKKYKEFEGFIKRVMSLQKEQHGGKPTYRYIDKALMVLGVPELRKKAVF